jgi:hypothetical protein
MSQNNEPYTGSICSLDINNIYCIDYKYPTYTIDYMNSGESSKPALFQTIFKPVKDIATSVGKNHYPRWRVYYTTTAFGNTGYSIAIFAVPGDKVFKFVLDVNDPFTDSNLPAYISKND